MKRNILMAAVLAAGIAGLTSTGTLVQAQSPTRTQAQTQDLVYGSQLMATQERNENQQRMRELKTQQERDQFRSEQHSKMQDRARQRGMSLPDAPPSQGKGAGMGPGSGRGMGSGGTAGAGSGRS